MVNKLFSKKRQDLFGKVQRNNIQGWALSNYKRELQSSRILEYSTNQTQWTVLGIRKPSGATIIRKSVKHLYYLIYWFRHSFFPHLWNFWLQLWRKLQRIFFFFFFFIIISTHKVEKLIFCFSYVHFCYKKLHSIQMISTTQKVELHSFFTTCSTLWKKMENQLFLINISM